MTANFKHPPAVSKRIRDSARGEECSLRLPCCNHNPETTVLAHLRIFGWSGIAQKPHDFLAVYACSDCHSEMDRRGDMCGFEDMLCALGETLTRLHKKGLMVLK
jgi:hypothetical protein